MEVLKSNKVEEFSSKGKGLYAALDKGIHDMENNPVVSHDEAMEMIEKRLKDYDL